MGFNAFYLLLVDFFMATMLIPSIPPIISPIIPSNGIKTLPAELPTIKNPTAAPATNQISPHVPIIKSFITGEVIIFKEVE